ncbi:MAG TPA: hypothetical protein VHP37_05495 [Burkholderiales bacterium]|nr:hypothetical protein [Burkholderiales bacterium]
MARAGGYAPHQFVEVELHRRGVVAVLQARDHPRRHAVGAYLRSEIAKWAAVTKRIGIKPE